MWHIYLWLKSSLVEGRYVKRIGFLVWLLLCHWKSFYIHFSFSLESANFHVIFGIKKESLICSSDFKPRIEHIWHFCHSIICVIFFYVNFLLILHIIFTFILYFDQLCIPIYLLLLLYGMSVCLIVVSFDWQLIILIIIYFCLTFYFVYFIIPLHLFRLYLLWYLIHCQFISYLWNKYFLYYWFIFFNPEW